MFVLISRQFPMNYGRTVSPGGIAIQPCMSYGLGQKFSKENLTKFPRIFSLMSLYLAAQVELEGVLDH